MTEVNIIYQHPKPPQPPYFRAFHPLGLWAKETLTFQPLNSDFHAMKLPVSLELTIQTFTRSNSVKKYQCTLHVTYGFNSTFFRERMRQNDKATNA